MRMGKTGIFTILFVLLILSLTTVSAQLPGAVPCTLSRPHFEDEFGSYAYSAWAGTTVYPVVYFDGDCDAADIEISIKKNDDSWERYFLNAEKDIDNHRAAISWVAEYHPEVNFYYVFALIRRPDGSPTGIIYSKDDPKGRLYVASRRCELTSGRWENSAGQAITQIKAGTTVFATVFGNEFCEEERIASLIKSRQGDGPERLVATPSMVTFRGGKARIPWTATYEAPEVRLFFSAGWYDESQRRALHTLTSESYPNGILQVMPRITFTQPGMPLPSGPFAPVPSGECQVTLLEWQDDNENPIVTVRGGQRVQAILEATDPCSGWSLELGIVQVKGGLENTVYHHTDSYEYGRLSVPFDLPNEAASYFFDVFLVKDTQRVTKSSVMFPHGNLEVTPAEAEPECRIDTPEWHDMRGREVYTVLNGTWVKAVVRGTEGCEGSDIEFSMIGMLPEGVEADVVPAPIKTVVEELYEGTATTTLLARYNPEFEKYYFTARAANRIISSSDAQKFLVITPVVTDTLQQNRTQPPLKQPPVKRTVAKIVEGACVKNADGTVTHTIMHYDEEGKLIEELTRKEHCVRETPQEQLQGKGNDVGKPFGIVTLSPAVSNFIKALQKIGIGFTILVVVMVVGIILWYAYYRKKDSERTRKDKKVN